MSGNVLGWEPRRRSARAGDREWCRWTAVALSVGNGGARRSIGRVRPLGRTDRSESAGWRRAVSAAVLVLMGLLAGWTLAVGSGPASAATDSGERAEGLSVRVTRGDSLWGISRRVYPDIDPRMGVARIKDANELLGDRLAIGQVLDLPRE